MIGDKYTKFNGSGVSRSTATLMKTNQTTSYRAGDDGDLEAGRATSFLVLAENNPFGNTNRFTDELGGSTYTNNIVIDWSTYNGSNVLGWDRRVNGGGGAVNKTWNNAIDEAAAHSNSVFTTGWRLCNATEIISIVNYSVFSPFNYSPFNYSPLHNGAIYIWTSTTLPVFTTRAMYYYAQDAILSYSTKTNSSPFRWLAVRTFTVTGTTLS